MRALWVGGVVLFAVLALACGGGRTARDDEPAKPKAKDAAKKWTRAEARSRLVGKTREEVKAGVGKPTNTTEYPASIGGGELWLYADTRLVWDEAAEKYVSFFVEFDADGKCKNVR